MKLSEVRELIYTGLADALAGAGFTLKRKAEEFARKIPGGKQMLGVPIWDYNPEFSFALNICYRFDAAEELFNLFSGSPPKYHSLTTTTITRLDFFTGVFNKRYKVTTPEETAAALGELAEILRRQIVPLLDRCQAVTALHELVQCNRTAAMPFDITVNPSGAMHAVILSHLAGRGDFDEIVARYLAEWSVAPDVDMPFNKLVQHLRER